MRVLYSFVWNHVKYTNMEGFPRVSCILPHHSVMCLALQLLLIPIHYKLANMKTFRELEKLPPDQQQKLITQVLKETLPAANDDILVDRIHPLLYQSGVITSEEATELLGISVYWKGEDHKTLH